MKNIARLTLLFVALSGSVSAQAAHTADLQVNGAIRPSGCTPSFPGGGVADYGVIPANSLRAGAYKQLQTKRLAFTITCVSRQYIMLGVSDNRRSSAMTEAGGASAMSFGLGTINGKKIGRYALSFHGRDVTTDGAANYKYEQIYSTDADWRWRRTGAGGQLGTDRRFAWAGPDMYRPAAFSMVSGILNVAPVLNKPENLPLTQEIPLDGSATLELTYL